MGDEDDDGEGLSFWEIGGYKRTTKRISEGNQLCSDLIEMVHERGELEAKFAAMLKSWNKKWSEKIEKGPEYGSMESAWKQALTAADREADVHLRVKDELNNSVLNEVKRWQKDNYHKGMMSLHLKEKKEIDEEFKKVQRPWAKKLRVVLKCKEDFHSVCQKEQSAQHTARTQESNPSVSEDQRVKLKDEVAKLGSHRQLARSNYEDALKDLNGYNARYMEDMKEVYQRCQEMENKRLEFVKSRLVAMHHALDLTSDVTMRQIYADYLVGVESANAKSDLKWWDLQRGVDMPMNWPQFEEYAPSLKVDIGSRSGIGFPSLRRQHDEPATISGGTIRRLDETPTYKINKSEEVTATPTSTTSIRTSTLTISAPIPTINGDVASTRSLGHSRESLHRHSNSSSDANPFNEEWSESPDKGDDSAVKPIATVKALFDYVGEESDELSFKEGDTFEKLGEKDDQGWCKGKKDGRIGLFPHAYVESI